MYVEGGIGAGVLTLVGLGFKLLSRKIDTKASEDKCVAVHGALSQNMVRGEKKFEELTKVQNEQSVVLARIDEKLLGISKKLDNLNGGQ